MTVNRRASRRGLGERIDRTKPVTFTFDGKRIECFEGDTIASALLSKGREIFGRSSKYHRPRGLLCVSGECPNCFLSVDGQPNVRSCITTVKQGMLVRSQNAWPSLDHDVGSIVDRFGSLLPVGILYKRFVNPRWIWPLARRFIRRAAGYGVISRGASQATAFEHAYKFVDVTIVGGGPSGLSAALEASGLGLRILLVDDQVELGGHLRYSSSSNDGTDEFLGLKGLEVASKLAARVASTPNIESLLDATCLGIYEGGSLAIRQQDRLLKVRTKEIIVCTGAFERPFLFSNNDLPGVYLARGVQRLVNLYGVQPGQKIVVVANNKSGCEIAQELVDAGIQVAALVIDQGTSNLSNSIHADKLRELGVPVIDQAVLVQALGKKGRVVGAKVARFEDDHLVVPGSERTVECDAIALSTGLESNSALLLHAGCEMRFDDVLGEFVVSKLVDGVQAAGDVTGIHDLHINILQGKLAGLRAADHCIRSASHPESISESKNTPPSSDLIQDYSQRISNLVKIYRAESRPGPLFTVPASNGKRIVCVCEDVTEEDITTAIHEGFDDLEPLKRYTTFSTGPCQGKMCGTVCAAIHAGTTGAPRNNIRRTRIRPPYQPMLMGLLNGPPHRPVKLTAMHHAHVSLGAKMMDMGEWKRPKNYGSMESEYRAIRDRVGIIDVSTLGRFLVKGPDAGRFLDFVYTHMYSTVKVGKARYALLLGETGKILDDGIIARLAEDEYFVTSSTGNTELVEQWLKWWQTTMEVRVSITNMTSGLAAINIAGPYSRHVLSKLTDADLSSGAFPYMSSTKATVAGIPSILLRIGFVGETGWEIHFPAEYGEYLWNLLKAEGREYGLRPVGIEAMRLLSLEKRHIWPTLDTDGTSDALETDLGWAVRFDKTDFVGKHYLLKTQQQGLSQKIVGFRANESDVIESGDVIIDSGKKIIGRVTSAGYSYSKQRFIGLGWVPMIFAKAGETVRIYHDGQLVTAEIVSEAFYDPDGTRMKS